MAGWRGKLLSYSARIVLIKTCIASIPVYLLSFFKFPRWALDLVNSQLAHCLWSDFEGNRKLHLANWHLVCMKKEYGGLGIPNIKNVNLCLLGTWVRRYTQDGGKIWRDIVDSKYIKRSPNIFASSTQNTSKFWQGVMWAAKALKFGYRWQIGDGTKIRLWEDIWFVSTVLAPVHYLSSTRRDCS
uniref:Reverse transcriptase zinc-binding domain-containing protein n=1 Tax=Aegilops tauschii subsp. strangulata TaxID=200361 RepID=A0A453STI6_AEGTS